MYIVYPIISIWLMAVVNFCINPPDVRSNLDKDLSLEENLQINEMESISEWFIEYCLDKKNMIPENQEDDSGGSLIEKVYFYFVIPDKISNIALHSKVIGDTNYIHHADFFNYPIPYRNIPTPPPNNA